VASDVLIVAAFYPELSPLRSPLGEALSGRIGDLRVSARAAGIGLPMAAVGAAMHLAELQPRAVVMIGTCGAYVGGWRRARARFAIGEVISARRVRLVDPAALAGAAQFPEPMSIVADAHTPIVNALAAVGASPADVATTLAITVDDAMAASIARETDSDVEHLEAHGVALACAARGVPFAAALGVANFVGSHARDEWRVHHRAVAAAAADRVIRWLREGAPGFSRP
jgi:nucleoside phosphorylase